MARVSVIMGVYNGENKITNAVNSILNQTYKDFELIICDDGSTDNTYSILSDLSSKDQRIKILKNETNKQLAFTLNKCLSIASGEYIARMDDDDYCHSDRLQKQVDFLDDNKEYSILGTSINYYDYKGIWSNRIVGGKVSKTDIFRGKTFVHPSVMIRKESLIKVGGYNESDNVKRTEDYDLWVRMYSEGFYGYNLEEILLDYYEDKNSTKKRKFRYRICEFNVKLKAIKLLNISFIYFPLAFKPLIIGLLPSKFVVLLHKKWFK